MNILFQIDECQQNSMCEGGYLQRHTETQFVVSSICSSYHMLGW